MNFQDPWVVPKDQKLIRIRLSSSPNLSRVGMEMTSEILVSLGLVNSLI